MPHAGAVMAQQHGSAIGSEGLARAFLDSLLTHPDVGFGFVTHDFRYLRVSPVLAALNGLPAEDHVGRTIRDVLPDLADQIEALITQVVDTGEAIQLDIVGETPAVPGATRDFACRYIPVHDGGEVVGIAALIIEVTAHKRAKEQFRSLVQAAPGAILGLATDGAIVHANPAAEDMFGHPAAELAGRSVDLVVPGAAEEPGARNRELSAMGADGRRFPVEVSLGPWVGGTATLFVADVTERRRLEADLAHQALHDPLTGLPNRTLFHDRLEHALRAAERARRRGRGAVHRPRPLQARQRQPRARRSATSCCWRSRRGFASASRAQRHRGPPRRRRVRRRAASASRTSARPAASPSGSRRAGRGRSTIARPRGLRHARASASRSAARARATPSGCCATRTPRCTAPRSAGARPLRGVRRPHARPRR